MKGLSSLNYFFWRIEEFLVALLIVKDRGATLLNSTYVKNGTTRYHFFIKKTGRGLEQTSKRSNLIEGQLVQTKIR